MNGWGENEAEKHGGKLKRFSQRRLRRLSLCLFHADRSFRSAIAPPQAESIVPAAGRLRSAASGDDCLLLPTLLSGVIAVLVATALTPLVRLVALRLGAVDAPGERRVHTATIPRLGGIGIAAAYTAATGLVLSTSLLDVPSKSEEAFLGYIAGALIIFLAGVYDDIRQLGAKRKLLAQLVAATVAWWGGARIYEVVNLPGLGSLDLGPVIAYLATVAWILAFTNAINLIDGLDGLAGGVVFFAALTNLIVAIMTDNVLAASLNAALAGSVLGFLFYNFNPAKIFMGDTGSLFLGYVLSAGALLSGRQKESTLAALLVPLIALGLPLTDTILAMVRRMLARRSIFAADRSHLHHRLLDLGLTHKRAVLVLYGCSVALSCLALLVAFGQDWQVGAALFSSVLLLGGTVRISGMFGRGVRPEISAPARALGRELPDFLLALREGSSPADAEELLGQLLSGACETAEVRIKDGWLWQWEATASGARKDGSLSQVTTEIRLPAGEALGTLSLTCRTTTAAPPPELLLMAEIVARSLGSKVVLEPEAQAAAGA